MNIASLLGALAGGWLADRWMRRSERGRIFTSALGMSLLIPSLFGVGNSGMDVARLLAQDPARLAETDINPAALEALKAGAADSGVASATFFSSTAVGNGTSLIIMAGIVAQLPVTLSNLFKSGSEGSISGLVIFLVVVLGFGLIAFICFMERAQRRVLMKQPDEQPGEFQQFVLRHAPPRALRPAW